VPKVRKPRTTSRAHKKKPDKSAAAAPTSGAAAPAADETIACMHCGHINPLPGGFRPGRTVSCKLCARMFSVEAAAAHVPPPPPEPPPPPPGMTPHAPDTESIDAPKNSEGLIYTPKLAPKKKLSRTFKLMFGLMIGIVLIACGIGAAVIIPHYNRTRLAAHRATCASNLRKVGGALDLYCMENGGNFPNTLGQLMLAQKLSADHFVCPASDQIPAPGASLKAQADRLTFGRYLSYAYLGRGLNKRTGPGAGVAAVVAYERLSNHGDGVHVLYADGRVAFIPEPKASQIIADLQAGKNPPSVTGF
jgi:prepilin-type processing-associated H-X9-DG protein